MPRDMSDDSVRLDELVDEAADDNDADGSFIAPPAKKKAKKVAISSDEESDAAMETESTGSSKKEEEKGVQLIFIACVSLFNPLKPECQRFTFKF